MAACTGKRGQLKPLDQTTDSGGLLADQPLLVTFLELQEDPATFQDRLIRVTGAYFPLPPPNCFPFGGPGAEWALISEGLRLDVVGFERLTRLISQDTLMTVDGFFRLYEGPVGCGKGAPLETAWYLEVIRIVQPNPLVGSGGAVDTGGEPGFPSPAVTPTVAGTLESTRPPGGGTEQPTNVPTATLIGTLPVVPTATGTVTLVAPLPSTSIPTATATALVTSEATATPAPSGTSTPAPGVPTSTPTSGPFPTPPPLPTATEGYPGVSTSTPYP